MTATGRAYVGLGSNLESPIEQVRAGMAALAKLPGTRVVQCSSLYRSAPVGVASQPDFINAVCVLETELEAESLMRFLLAIECEHGRVRGGGHGEPRTLDLDLLLYGDLELGTAEVTLPHPRLHERAFVLYPLLEVEPALRVPGRGAVAELARGCATQAVERLKD